MLITNKDILNILGKKIKNVRLHKGYTQDFLAEKINISTDLLRNIENGRNIGSLATLLNICNALEITPNFLFSDLINDSSFGFDSKLHDYTSQLSKNDRTILKDIIIHIDKNY